MEFTKKTNEIYGARNAGYKLDGCAGLEIDNDLADKIAKLHGERYLDDLLDMFCDFDGDLFEDESGQPYAVAYVYYDCREIPLCWQKMKRCN